MIQSVTQSVRLYEAGILGEVGLVIYIDSLSWALDSTSDVQLGTSDCKLDLNVRQGPGFECQGRWCSAECFRLRVRLAEWKLA